MAFTGPGVTHPYHERLQPHEGRRPSPQTDQSACRPSLPSESRSCLTTSRGVSGSRNLPTWGGTQSFDIDGSWGRAENHNLLV